MTTPTTVQVQIQLRADTAANWASEDPTLLANEVGRETDTGKIKIGDGTTAWNTLAYQPFGAEITDADIAADAEIAVSKLADGAARQLLQTDAAGTGVEWTDDVDVPGTLDVTGAATFDDNVTIEGDLTVNGTTTTIDTETLLVKDKNIELAVVDTPSDATADGGGITLKGATDKTFNWVDSTDAWTSSEHVNLASGKAYYINGTEVLSGSALGAAIEINTSQNITLQAQADLRFADADSSNWVAFQAPATVSSNVTWTLPDADGTTDQVLTTDGSGTLSWQTPSAAGGVSLGLVIALS